MHLGQIRLGKQWDVTYPSDALDGILLQERAEVINTPALECHNALAVLQFKNLDGCLFNLYNARLRAIFHD